MADDPARLRYIGSRGREYHEAKRAIPPAAYSWVANVRLRKLAPHVSPNDTVLEYGVGFGWNLAMLRCRRRIGFDIADYVAEQNREHGIEFVQSTTAIPDQSIDVVICHHALEHVLEPAGALQEMGRMLRMGGKLLLFAPYEKERRYRHFNPNEPNHHLYSWNVQTLGNLLNELGYHVLSGRLRAYGYDRAGSVWSSRLHLGEAGYHLIRKAIWLFWPLLEVQLVATR